MDARQFDALARTLTAAPTRRGIAGALVGLTLSGMLGLRDTEARRKRKKGKGKKKGGNRSTCNDGIRNGRESDIDCGGRDCPRCANDKRCATREDCTGAFCANGTCQACSAASECGYDADGFACFCGSSAAGGPMVCHTVLQTGQTVSNCAACPPGTVYCLQTGVGAYACHKACGAA
jgi:hypothetical protein